MCVCVWLLVFWIVHILLVNIYPNVLLVSTTDFNDSYLSVCCMSFNVGSVELCTKLEWMNNRECDYVTPYISLIYHYHTVNDYHLSK